MNDTSPLYQANLKRLISLNAHLALALQQADKSHLSSCYTQGEQNLRFQKGSKTYFLHASTGPREEAKQWFKTLSLENCTALYIYGIGLGYYFEAALGWLQSNPRHHLIFLESDRAVLHFLLMTPLGSQLIHHPQVDIQDVSEMEISLTALYWTTWDQLFENYFSTALFSYTQEHADFYSLLSNHLHFQSQRRTSLARELQEGGSSFFTNYYSNLRHLSTSYAGTALFGKFKGIPAIICGAGPSLEKQIPLLKQIEQENRALLIAPGSAMNILNFHHLTPHFGVAIDPNPEIYYRLAMQRAFETPFFYRNRLQFEALNEIHGPHLFIPGSGIYSTSQWFEKQLDLSYEEIDEGQNVVNFAVEIAYRLGCSPLIFVGLDLSSTPEKHYAVGIEKHPLRPAELPPNSHLGQPFWIKNKEGASIQTYWPWIAEANWLATFAKQHPSIPLMNSTEGGLDLFSIPFCPLQEIFKNILTTSLDLAPLIHQALQEACLSLQPARILQSMQIFNESLKKCKQLCDTILHDIRTQGEINNDLYDAALKSLKKETAFKFLIHDFDRFFLKSHHLLLRDLYLSYPSPKFSENYTDMMYQRYTFLLQTLQINQKILEAASRTPPLDQGNSPPSVCSSPNSLEKKMYYYTSGQLASVQTFKNHQRHGTHSYYFETGVLKTTMTYQTGLLEGAVCLYYPNGQMKKMIEFKQGAREGLEKSWDENGQLFTQIEYKKGKACKALYWLNDGTLGTDKEISL